MCLVGWEGPNESFSGRMKIGLDSREAAKGAKDVK